MLKVYSGYYAHFCDWWNDILWAIWIPDHFWLRLDALAEVCALCRAQSSTLFITCHATKWAWQVMFWCLERYTVSVCLSVCLPRRCRYVMLRIIFLVLIYFPTIFRAKIKFEVKMYNWWDWLLEWHFMIDPADIRIRIRINPEIRFESRITFGLG